MKKRKFTEEQLLLLQANPYTLSVNEDMIRFTVEFKRFVLEELEKPGMTFPKVLKKANYDLEILGRKRAEAILRRIRKQAASPEGLRETGASRESILAKDLSKQRTETALKHMQQRVAYLEQELDLLKKISQIPIEDDSKP